VRTQRTVIVAALALAAATCIPAQTTVESNVPGAGFDQPQPAPPTVRIYTREVIVDVNVTDAAGNPVPGLTRSDFTVTENGQPMTLRSFREHAPEAAETAVPAGPALPHNTFANTGPPEGVHPLFILLFDALDTPIASQAVVRQRMVNFAAKLPPNTHMAVMAISPTGRLSVVQGFTTDPAVVKKALANQKLDIGIPPLEDFGQEPTDNPALDIQGSPQVAAAMASAQPRVDETLECNHTAMRVIYTSNAFAQIARYTSGMPGRKNLVWYTGAFPTGLRCYDAGEEIRSALSLLEHSHVVVYPVDSRALDIYARNGPTSRIGQIMTVEHLTMESVAEQTGGRAFYNNNDLAAAALTAINSGISYYTLTYIPTNQNLDTRLRRISVTVDKPNLTLVYKQGYNATPRGRTTTLGGRPIQTTTPVQSAMMRGAPQPTEILFEVKVTPAKATETALPPGNASDPKIMKPPYRRLSIGYNVEADTLAFNPSPDGDYHSQFEYAVNVYDNEGRLLNSSSLAAKPNLPPAAYQSIVEDGLVLHQDIDVPAKGDYILRIGVHDLTTDHVGALEIPTTSIAP
jgi:VWFA-related protein